MRDGIRLAAMVLCGSLLGCTKARPVEGTQACVAWEDSLGAAVQTACASCHSGDAAAAGYDVTTYLGVIGARRAAGRTAMAGDASSLLLTVLGPDATGPHAGQGELHSILSTWVLTCNLANRNSDLHARGIVDPQSSDFHGALLRSRNYDFSLCKSCHGEDFRGGKSDSSCYQCHNQPPTDCVTCHTALGPSSGAHRTHTQPGPLGSGLLCSECHVMPADWSQPGHILTTSGALDPPPVEVVFGPTATLAPYPRAPFMGRDAASFENGTCNNVYCHAPKLVDGAAVDSAPRWDTSVARACNNCHGAPPAEHPVGACARCHSRVVDGAGGFADVALHLDGKISLGDDSGTCQACHATLSAPHASHLEGKHGLASPVACNECHLVPTAVGSPGHLDATLTVEVFPAGGAGPLATAYNATPSYTSSTATCSGVACHGGGDKLALDGTATINRAPIWAEPAAGTGPIVCGSCHGLPPQDTTHDPKWKLGLCYQCHPTSIDDHGTLLVVDGKTTHLNGKVDVR